MIIGTGAGIAVTRPWGAEFPHWWKLLLPLDRLFRPSRCWDRRSGDRVWSATSDYRLDPFGVLPVLQATLAGLGAIDASGQKLRKVWE